MDLAGGVETCFVPKKAKEDAVRVRARLLLGMTIAWSPSHPRRRSPPTTTHPSGARRHRLRTPVPSPTSPRAAVGARMSALLGQQIVVENRPAPASSIAAEYVARAAEGRLTRC